MSDEEIEKALACCDDIADCDNCPYLQFACKPDLHSDARDYINRLKEACQSAIQSFSRMETLYKVKCTETECAEEKIRKETAKQIFACLEEQERQGKAVLPKGFLFTARKAYGLKENKHA